MTPSFYFQWRCHSKTKKKPYPSSREESVPTGCFALCSQHEKVFSNSLFSLFLSLPHPCPLDLPLWMRRSSPQTTEEGTAEGQGWRGWTLQQRHWPCWRVWVPPGLLSCREWEVGWTAAPETRMWHLCTWGTPLDSTTSSSTLTKREQGPAVSSPWPGPTTRPSKPVSGETPSMFFCLHKLPSHSWMETRVGSGWYSQHGTQGHLIPVLPFLQGPWRKHMKQLLLEPFMLRRSFPLVKITWSLALQQAELRAMH